MYPDIAKLTLFSFLLLLSLNIPYCNSSFAMKGGMLQKISTMEDSAISALSMHSYLNKMIFSSIKTTFFKLNKTLPIYLFEI